jgi:hypothetical protein
MDIYNRVKSVAYQDGFWSSDACELVVQVTRCLGLVKDLATGIYMKVNLFLCVVD